MSNRVQNQLVLAPVMALVFLCAAFHPACAQVSDTRDVTTPADAIVTAPENDPSNSTTVRSEQRRDLSAERQALEQTVADLRSRTTMSSDDLANRDSLDKQLQMGRMRLAQAGQQLSSLESTDQLAQHADFSGM